jgi:hypothetical protein
MDDELGKQLERIEKTVAEIVDAVRNLHGAQFAAGEINPSEINLRLRRFLEKKK